MCDAHVLHVVSLSLCLLRSICAARWFIPSGTLHFFTGVQRVRCPCLRSGLLPFQHGGPQSMACHVRRELLLAVGLHPLPKWSHCTEAGSRRYINIIGKWNGVWPPACVTLRSGRTSQPGDPRPNPQGAGADRPYLLLSTRDCGMRPARTGAPGCRAGTRSLRSDQPRSVSGLPRGRSLPDRVHNNDQPIRLALTELVGVYGRCDPCSHEDPG